MFKSCLNMILYVKLLKCKYLLPVTIILFNFLQVNVLQLNMNNPSKIPSFKVKESKYIQFKTINISGYFMFVDPCIIV